MLVDSRLLQMQQCSKYSSSWQSKKMAETIYDKKNRSELLVFKKLRVSRVQAIYNKLE